jgi:hypothetical protein
MARIDKLEAADPKRREDLKAAIESGAFKLAPATDCCDNSTGSLRRILP